MFKRTKFLGVKVPNFLQKCISTHCILTLLPIYILVYEIPSRVWEQLRLHKQIIGRLTGWRLKIILLLETCCVGLNNYQVPNTVRLLPSGLLLSFCTFNYTWHNVVIDIIQSQFWVHHFLEERFLRYICFPYVFCYMKFHFK